MNTKIYSRVCAGDGLPAQRTPYTEGAPERESAGDVPSDPQGRYLRPKAGLHPRQTHVRIREESCCIREYDASRRSLRAPTLSALIDC